MHITRIIIIKIVIISIISIIISISSLISITIIARRGRREQGTAPTWVASKGTPTLAVAQMYYVIVCHSMCMLHYIGS